MKGHLKVLELKNFQKHQNLKFELTSGLNIIAGPTDSGKSSIFRAIRWLLTNRPRGIDAYKTYQSQGPISVSMVFEDGEVRRIKGAKENDYVLRVGDKATTFSTVKTDVPPGVKEFLRIPDFVVQGQHDQYYLLQSSPGEVVREIQRLVDLDIISSVIQMANQHINTCRANLRAFQKAKEDQEENLKRLVDVPSLVEEADLIEAEQSILQAKERELEKVEELVVKIDDYETELWTLQGVLVFKPEIEALQKEVEFIEEQKSLIEEKQVKVDKMKGLLGALVAADKQLGGLETEIETLHFRFEGISKMVGGICPLCNGTGKVTL